MQSDGSPAGTGSAYSVPQGGTSSNVQFKQSTMSLTGSPKPKSQGRSYAQQSSAKAAPWVPSKYPYHRHVPLDGKTGSELSTVFVSNLPYNSSEEEILIKFNSIDGMLEERCGDPQVLASAHMSKLLRLESISNLYDVKGLRRLYDEVETQEV